MAKTDAQLKSETERMLVEGIHELTKDLLTKLRNGEITLGEMQVLERIAKNNDVNIHLRGNAEDEAFDELELPDLSVVK